jgi:hypothetical protein
MELIVLIGIIWVLYKVFGDSSGGSSPPPSSRDSGQPYQKPTSNTYRPTTQAGRSKKIDLGTSKPHVNSPLSDLTGLHDAYTGAPLNAGLGLYQCENCKVFYHASSMEVLRSENQSQCVACQSTRIINVDGQSASRSGRDYNPSIVTLTNYRQFVNSVVTFEGTVTNVNVSRRGDDYAAMFERKSWVEGFKLVFFKGAVRRVGGSRYIMALQGKRIRVRGLVVKHPTFGYEIIVSEKSMILSVN